MTDREIAESIVENNLHGIDIDPRAIQIAAAAVFLKAKSFAREARPRKVNLVAPVLQLGKLPADDPAVVALRRDLKREVGIPEELTTKLLTALAGVDYLGSLLKVDTAVEEAIQSVELPFERVHGQGDIFSGFPAQQVKLSVGEAKATILDKLEQFLAKHSKSEDLGLRLDGEQLAAGVRFVRLAREGTYDVVVGNPPYQATSKTASFGYVTDKYPMGKADLYAAFLERGLELVRPGGMSALVTMRGWMFLGKGELRKWLLRAFDLRAIVDLDSGAFDEVSAAQVVLSVDCSVFVKGKPGRQAVAIRPTPVEDKASTGMTNRKRAGLLVQVGRYEFDPRGFEVIEGEPIVYWWSRHDFEFYEQYPKLGKACYTTAGAQTSPKERFLRRPWEVPTAQIHLQRATNDAQKPSLIGLSYVPYLDGADGAVWFEPAVNVIDWGSNGLALKAWHLHKTGTISKRVAGESYYFVAGVAANSLGSVFNGRAHRWQSVTGTMGTTSYPNSGVGVAQLACLFNSRRAKAILSSLNPTVHFNVGDVNRLPAFAIPDSQRILEVLEGAFSGHESRRESSIEFRRPSSASNAKHQGARAARAPSATCSGLSPGSITSKITSRMAMLTGSTWSAVEERVRAGVPRG